MLDCSVTISWFMFDESSKLSTALLDKIAYAGAIVPSICQLEVGNVLLVSQRKKRITTEQRRIALHTLNELPIVIDKTTSKHAWQETIELAEKHSLSLYDACYLELALRCSLPLATFDKHLSHAGTLENLNLVF